MTPRLDIPVIDTEDLVLRGYTEADFEPFAAFCASDRARFAGGPIDRASAWRSFMAAVGHWALRGYGMWMVEHRNSGAAAGRVGIILNESWDEPELAWHIFDGFEGQGLAYQASIAARRHAALQMGLNAVMSYIDPANTRSLALAQRLGATYERDGTVLGNPCQIWRHPRIDEATA